MTMMTKMARMMTKIMLMMTLMMKIMLMMMTLMMMVLMMTMVRILMMHGGWPEKGARPVVAAGVVNPAAPLQWALGL